ncbi:MAG: hypothetical protein K8T91_10135 [Planctomycetes bacterium]|nr:hypothetical protein [Planctomycetota bacterium]
MSIPPLRPLSALRRLLLGMAIALVLVLAVRGLGRGPNATPSAALPARLPVDATVALLDGDEGPGVSPAAHVDASGGRLEFAPPPLGSSHNIPPSIEDPQPAEPSVSLLDKMSDRFDPAVTLRSTPQNTITPRASAPPVVVPPVVASPARVDPGLTQPSQAVRRLPVPQPEPPQPFATTAIDSTRRTPQEEMVTRNAPPVTPSRPVTSPTPMRPPVVSVAPPTGTPSVAAANDPAVALATRPTQPNRYANSDRYAHVEAPLASRSDAPPKMATVNIRPVEESTSRPERVAAAPARQPLMPTMAAPRQPTPRRSLEWQRQMTPVAARADAQIRSAFETCGRGALFAGRSEMIQALGLIAQNADALERGSAHSDALAAGMRAMAEAESFALRGSRLESELDMATLVASHRTPVVREALAGADRGQKITPLDAQNRYYTYAQQQLAEATAGLPVGAIALYGLGKIHNTLATADSEARVVEEPQAMTMYQAALIVDPGNPLAAHELGVMLARYQRYDEALAMLQHSATIASLPETWQNLSIVHAQRGEADMARRAQQEAENARTRLSKGKPASHPALARGSVRWLNASEFAQLRPGDSNLRPAGDAKTNPSAPVPTPETSKPSGVMSWLPWTTRR